MQPTSSDRNTRQDRQIEAADIAVAIEMAAASNPGSDPACSRPARMLRSARRSCSPVDIGRLDHHKRSGLPRLDRPSWSRHGPQSESGEGKHRDRTVIRRYPRATPGPKSRPDPDHGHFRPKFAPIDRIVQVATQGDVDGVRADLHDRETVGAADGITVVDREPRQVASRCCRWPDSMMIVPPA